MDSIIKAILAYYKKDSFVRISSTFMLVWFLILRWFVLALTCESSVAWLHDPLSAGIFIYTMGFLIAIMSIPKEYQSQLFVESVILSTIHGICLVLMLKLYGEEPTFANYNFLLLDALIFAYSVLMATVCWNAKKFATNQTKITSLVWNTLKCYCMSFK